MPLPPSLNLPSPYPEHVERFQQLYERRFGIALGSEQALEQLTHLLTIVRYRQENRRHRHGSSSPLASRNGSPRQYPGDNINHNDRNPES